MNSGDGSSRAAFQLDPFDLKGCIDAFGALVSEGANSVLVEPALFVLDLVQRLSKVAPIGCFSVSGECELMKYGPREDAHAKTTAPEFCRAAKRAGADFIATYAALEVGELLKKQEV
jgi:delta-aminolevulinic acid dehydratase/porphobilinogen synthase